MAKKKQPGNSSNWLTVIATAIITMIVGLVLVSKYGDKFLKPSPVKEPREINVFYIDGDGLRLAREKRTITRSSLEKELSTAVGFIIKGPRSAKLFTAIPRDTRLLGLKVDGDTARVDFSSHIAKNHTGGSTGELLTIYSIVDTLVLGFPEINRVVILVDGKKKKTLAGHVDVSFPLEADRKIIKK